MRRMVVVVGAVMLAAGCGGRGNGGGGGGGTKHDVDFVPVCVFVGSCTTHAPDESPVCGEWSINTLEYGDITEMTRELCYLGPTGAVSVFSSEHCAPGGICCTHFWETLAPGDDPRTTRCDYNPKQNRADYENACISTAGLYHASGQAPEPPRCASAH